MTAIGLPVSRDRSAAGRLALAIGMLGNEVGKGLRLVWNRPGLLVSGVVSGALVYLMMRFFVGGGHITTRMVALTLPALLAHEFAVKGSMQGSGGIAEEVNGGTLEQSQLSPASSTLLVAGRLAALGAEQLVGVIVLGLAFGVGYGVHYSARPDVLVPVVLIAADALAYVLLMTALTLRFASIGAIVHVAGMVVMFFNGMLIPVSWFPHGVQIFTRFVPTSLGVEALNSVLAGRGLGAVWSDATLPLLLVHVAVTAGLGWIIYMHTLRRAQREGGLSP